MLRVPVAALDEAEWVELFQWSPGSKHYGFQADLEESEEEEEATHQVMAGQSEG